MKISNILQNVMVEEVKNKKLFDSLITKWREQKPNLTPEEGETLFNRFQEIKNGLSPNRPQVRSFLYRFDGRHGYEKFDPDLIKDITKYTYRQIKSLIGEYDDQDMVGDEIIPNIFSGKDIKSTKEKIEASKQLWYDQDSAIINEEGFRVYSIKNQAMSIRFGYYAEYINGSQKNDVEGIVNASWCVTWRGANAGGENRWGSYRSGTPSDRTFYFVIDESKNPKRNKHHLSALQRVKSVRDGYMLTSVRNDGDTTMNWDEICNVYPKIREYKDLIVEITYSKAELSEKNVVGQINETENNAYEFRRVDRQLKKAYINNNGELKKPESWMSMDESLRALYITLTTKETIRNKFSNFEFLNEIKKVGNEFTLLDNKIKQLGYKDGIGFILTDLIKHEFRHRRDSINNPQIKIFESKVNGLCGVYNVRTAGWVNFDGITYEPLFKNTDSDVYFDEEEQGYFVEKYEKGGGGSFYTIYPSETEAGDAYILSEKAWDQLKPKLYVEKGDIPIPRIKDFDPTGDVDIKETKKRV
jgi:hypothetical protein